MKRFTTTGVSLLLAGLCLVAALLAGSRMPVNAQVPRHLPTIPGMPGSLVELSSAISSSATIATPLAPVPLGVALRGQTGLIGLLKVTSSPTGGTGQQLDVYATREAECRELVPRLLKDLESYVEGPARVVRVDGPSRIGPWKPYPLITAPNGYHTAIRFERLLPKEG